ALRDRRLRRADLFLELLLVLGFDGRQAALSFSGSLLGVAPIRILLAEFLAELVDLPLLSFNLLLLRRQSIFECLEVFGGHCRRRSLAASAVLLGGGVACAATATKLNIAAHVRNLFM